MTLQTRWNEVCAATIGTSQFWRLSVDHRSAYAALAPLVREFAKGRVLDAGCGRLAWRTLLMEKATSYIAADYAQVHPDITVVCDLTQRIPLETASVDTVFCCSVLEHVENPFSAMDELARVVAVGGTLILSVPFRYYLHGAPIDYFRFTSFGVNLMASRAGLVVERIETSGGLAHEAANAVSMAIAAVAGSSAIGISISAACSFVLWKLARLIDAFDRGERFVQNINAVLRKAS